MPKVPDGITPIKGKRGTRYQVRVETGKRDRDGKRKREKRTFKTLEEAREFKTTTESQRLNGVGRSSFGKTPLGEYLADWPDAAQATKRKPRSEGTLKDYRGVVRKYLLDSPLASIPINDLQPDDFYAFYARFPESSAAKGEGRSVRARIHRTLFYALTDLVERRLINRHPMQGVHQDYVEADKVYWSADDVLRFLSAAREITVGWSKRRPVHFTAFYHAVFLSLHAGLRLREFLDNEWANVRWDQNSIYIPKHLAKYGLARTVKLDATTMRVLSELRQLQFSECGRRERMFTYENGDPVSHGAFQGWFEKAVAAAGVDPRSAPHAMRHTHSAILLTAGWSIFKVSRRLGHRAVETTDRTYGHLCDDDQRQGYETTTQMFDEIVGTGEQYEAIAQSS